MPVGQRDSLARAVVQLDPVQQSASRFIHRAGFADIDIVRVKACGAHGIGECGRGVGAAGSGLCIIDILAVFSPADGNIAAYLLREQQTVLLHAGIGA